MMFDLSTDVGEFTNITPGNPTQAQAMYDEMMRYFGEVGARISWLIVLSESAGFSKFYPQEL